MKKLLLALLIVPQIAFAALPPYYSSTREIKEIIDSDELHDLLGSGKPVDAIERQDNGWIVKSGDRTILVLVHYTFSMPGKGKIRLEFQP